MECMVDNLMIDEKKIKKILSDILKIKIDSINSKTSHETIKNWDSVAHLHIVMALENNFKVSFTPNEVVSLISYSKIISVLRKKIK